MSKLKSVFILLGFVALVGMIMIVNSPKTAAAPTPGSAPVTVVNTPLPVQGTVTGNVGVSGTVNSVQSGSWNVGVTGTVPAQQSGTWNVGIEGTPSVTVAGGTVASKSPTLTKYQTFDEQGLDPDNHKDYIFDAPMKVSTILVCTHDDIFLAVRTNGVLGSPAGFLAIGEFGGNSGEFGGSLAADNPCQVFNVGMQIPATGIQVRNPALVTHATFQLTVLSQD